MPENTPVENVVIIGGGPAGLAASVYNARASLKPVVFAGSPPGGQLMLTSDVENYPGFVSILGPELVDTMRKQTQTFGTRIVDENILKVDFSARPFKLYVNPSALKKLYPEQSGEVSAEETVVLANAVIIATGAKALWLDLPSEQRLRGKGVSACATCDGFFFKGKTVAVVGGGDTAMEEALTLTKFATKIYVIHRREAFRASKIMQDRVLHHKSIEVVWNTSVAEVLGEMKVEGLKLTSPKGESNLAVDGLFLAIGHKPDTDIFKGQIELDEQGYVLILQRKAVTLIQKGTSSVSALNEKTSLFEYMTSVPGVFAAGDNVDHLYRQAATAAGAGVAAALEAERWLELHM